MPRNCHPCRMKHPKGAALLFSQKEQYNLRGRELGQLKAEFIPFSANTRMSGIEVDGRSIRKGAVDAIAEYLQQHGSPMPPELHSVVEDVARQGGTPLVVAENGTRDGRDLPQGHW